MKDPQIEEGRPDPLGAAWDGAGVNFALFSARAERVTLVMDNLNTHSLAPLYEAFEAGQARRLIDRLEVVYTPKHGSWLNMAEIEPSVLSRQCMGGRVPDQPALAASVERWQKDRNANRAAIDWQFTTAAARIKLRRLYPQSQA